MTAIRARMQYTDQYSVYCIEYSTGITAWAFIPAHKLELPDLSAEYCEHTRQIEAHETTLARSYYYTCECSNQEEYEHVKLWVESLDGFLEDTLKDLLKEVA